MYYVLWKNKRVFFSQKKEEEEGRREESQLLVDAKQSCWRNKINNFNGMYMFKKIIKKVFILFY